MWSQYYQPNVSQLLRKSILSLCSENVPYDDKLEVDGIICISKGTEGDHIVVKLHEVLDSISKDYWKCTTPSDPEQFEPREDSAVKAEPDEEEIFTIVEDDAPMDCKIPLTLTTPLSIRTTVEDNVYSYMPRARHHQNRNKSSGEESMEGIQGSSHNLSHLDLSSHQEDDDLNNTLSQAVNSEHQPGNFICRICGNNFYNFSRLSAHGFEEHGRFTCKQCLNTFSMLCNLKRHERLHAGRKPYTCVTCGKGFSRNSDLRLHETKRHKNEPVNYSQPGNETSSSGGSSSGNSQSRHSHRSKSSHLNNILSKLGQKNQLLMQKNDSRSRRKARSGSRHNYPVVIDLSSDIENSFTDPKSSDEEDQEEQPSARKERRLIEVKKETDDGSSNENGLKESLVPVPVPLFTRSILRPNRSVDKNPAHDQPKIIHIVPSNSTSGGHMEEAAESINNYRSNFLSVDHGLDDGSIFTPPSSMNTVHHGHSFGRIVFPGQNDSGDTGSDLSHSRTSHSDSIPKAKELPFRTYVGSNSDTIQQSESADDRPKSSSPSTYPPPSPSNGGGNSSSRSNSPVAREEQNETPGLISLDRDYWCRMCKTQWSSFRNYEQHYVQHHLRYPCQFCDQTFSNKNNRSRHIRSHTGQREHTCQECGKSFSRSDTLKEHQIIHTDGYLGDKCTYCHIVIKKKAELLGHIKKCSQRQKQKFNDIVEMTTTSAYKD